jgi:uncharacterized protein YjbI with pentapeptide repeats
MLINPYAQLDGTGASFKAAKLRGSRFYRANLKDADFSYADLAGASLEDTSLQETDFTNAILEVDLLLMLCRYVFTVLAC